MFTDADINMPALKQRAFNLRWATLPEGIIPLTAADPDFQSAPEIADAIVAYTKERTFAYGPAQGLQSFRQTVAEVMNERRNINTSEELVLPVDSAAQGMFIIAKHCLQPGDEAIIFDPVDFLFKKSVEYAGAEAVLFPIDVETGKYDIEYLRSLINNKTKLLCICNPLNPSGKVFTREELKELGDITVEYDLKIMSDEIWSDIVYDNIPFTSIASISPDVHQRTFTVFGFSKSYGLAGLRVGYVLAPNKEEYDGLMKASWFETTAFGVSTLSQAAAEAAYKHCRYWVDDFVNLLSTNRNIAVEKLNAMPNVSCHTPSGCYVVFPNIKATGYTSEEITNYILREAKVAVVPGMERWFGAGAEGHIRLCIATSTTILTEALNRIEKAMLKLENEGM